MTRQAMTGLTCVLLIAGTTRAQIPGAPAIPGAAGAAAAPATAATATSAAGAAGGAKNIWSFFCKTPEQKAQCKERFCKSSIGQFVNNMLLPASAFSGGLIGPCCPDPATTPNPDDLNKSSSSAQGAAAKIKAEEAQAKAKIEAIEYLASVDCRYYPEAEAGMISGLRAEKNECVRLAAAKALASGCCCSAKVVKALTMTVNCSNKDGFPAEASELVRIFAFVALERCMKKCVEGEEETPPEQPPAVKQALYEALKPVGSAANLEREILLAAYFAPTVVETNEKIFSAARQAIAKGIKVSPATIARISGPKNVYDALLPAGFTGRAASSEVITAEAIEVVPQAPVATVGMPPPATTEPPMKQAVAQAAVMATPSMQDAATKYTVVGSTTPTVPAPPVPGMYREARPTPPSPSWITQRVMPTPTAVESPRPSAPPTRSTGRGNLFNIFQDATKR